ncbi:actin-binding protein WASF1-like [Macrobrachium nipponense]|uniref:actin-binding protein WASF1-like n=1 Tax=Macrobrachium nipponense TaxID=159736 RepID=UPI0030C8BB1B
MPAKFPGVKFDQGANTRGTSFGGLGLGVRGVRGGGGGGGDDDDKIGNRSKQRRGGPSSYSALSLSLVHSQEKRQRLNERRTPAFARGWVTSRQLSTPPSACRNVHLRRPINSDAGGALPPPPEGGRPMAARLPLRPGLPTQPPDGEPPMTGVLRLGGRAIRAAPWCTAHSRRPLPPLLPPPRLPWRCLQGTALPRAVATNRREGGGVRACYVTAGSAGPPAPISPPRSPTLRKKPPISVATS